MIHLAPTHLPIGPKPQSRSSHEKSKLDDPSQHLLVNSPGTVPMKREFRLRAFLVAKQRFVNDGGCISSWWFQPICKILVKMKIFPNKDENKKSLKPPPRFLYCISPTCPMQISKSCSMIFKSHLLIFLGRFHSFKSVGTVMKCCMALCLVLTSPKKSGDETNAYTTNDESSPLATYSRKQRAWSSIAIWPGILRINCSTCSKHLKKPTLCIRNTN